MNYSKEILEFKKIQEQLSELKKQLRNTLDCMLPDVQKAIKGKMDWPDIDAKRIDYVFGSLKIDATTSIDLNARYVFTIEPRKGDEFWISLDFREDFSKY